MGKKNKKVVEDPSKLNNLSNLLRSACHKYGVVSERKKVLSTLSSNLLDPKSKGVLRDMIKELEREVNSTANSIRESGKSIFYLLLEKNKQIDANLHARLIAFEGYDLEFDRLSRCFAPKPLAINFPVVTPPNPVPVVAPPSFELPPPLEEESFSGQLEQITLPKDWTVGWIGPIKGSCIHLWYLLCLKKDVYYAIWYDTMLNATLQPIVMPAPDKNPQFQLVDRKLNCPNPITWKSIPLGAAYVSVPDYSYAELTPVKSEVTASDE